MTTVAENSVVCGNCGQEFTCQVVVTTNTIGSADLDTRPPEMRRSTMWSWIQRCPTCGYCAPDVEKCDQGLRPVVESAAYRAQLTDPRYPELASSFVCAGMLADAGNAKGSAGWAYLRAAWALDDAKERELAANCRSLAADRFLEVLSAGLSFSSQPGASEAIVTDCLRRAGRGKDAVEVIDRAAKQEFPEILQKVLAFQRALIQRGDSERHLIKDALAPA